MYPELFELPFTHLTIKSYGLMMVIGFLSAVFVIRRLSRSFTPDPGLITNAALYTLIAGVVGARLFYVVHYFDNFRGDPASMFAIWQGGLELLGGVIFAIVVVFFYLRRHKLPIRRYLDALAVGLMLALVFGRIGCFLNGCCFGKPTDQLWGVRFPYNSFAYASQVRAQPNRNRAKPQLELPANFFNYSYGDAILKPHEQLSQEQKDMVKYGPYRCLHVHPTQLYSSAAALLCSFLLYLFWRRSQKTGKLFAKPGSTFAMMFILYGIARFFLEFVRADNPFEYAWWAIYRGGTVSQNLGIYMVISGVLFMAIFQKMKNYKPATKSKRH
ncbi:MAG TPA: prolipoprotein diacylglyceryl transferase [Sedimentisphaerales bacterium]|nr:prolipoprotein diacylglyceryl transferase [Sedimentisphaerales bacterium]